jgi:type I restriction-modification system DNA methylase subunit
MTQPTLLPFSDLALDASYSTIYQSLSHLREVFHKAGRFDDSNAKLDEVVKLLATYIAYKRGLLKAFPSPSVQCNGTLISELQSVFAQAAQLPCYLHPDGRSIFGASPSLSLQAGDEELAKELLRLVQSAIDVAFINKELDNPFDILNEAFGHFVRDNFRGNIEDAQYMTPPEVVDFMVDLALFDLAQEEEDHQNAFVVADPSCGVGSFLASFYHRAKQSGALKNKALKIIGQDKVERMVRLSKINLTFFDVLSHSVTSGNSLLGGSALDALNEQVDLILTNPPFGAKFDRSDIWVSGTDNLPFFTSIGKETGNIDSELLFVDRNLALLREGGRLLVVLPDSVISAKGLPSLLRQHLRMNAVIKAIIELPAVTFGQAGTRTKTAILYLQKRTKLKDHPAHVFIAKAESLGFEVSSRKGVQVKVAKGRDELPAILRAYQSAQEQPKAGAQILSETPSAVLTDYQDVLENSWTPNHYNALRLKAVHQVTQAIEIDGIPLEELVEFKSDTRRAEPWHPGSHFISVLHVIGEGMLDIPGIAGYAPKTPGIRVNPGEILLSKINPRIPRALVVPALGDRLLCSTEFEVMIPRNGLDPYHIAFLLLSTVVQNQIRSLTSGTSASHNRIKTRELAQVQLPLPTPSSPAAEQLQATVREYKKSIQKMIEETIKLAALRRSENIWKQPAVNKKAALNP